MSGNRLMMISTMTPIRLPVTDITASAAIWGTRIWAGSKPKTPDAAISNMTFATQTLIFFALIYQNIFL